MSWKKITLFKYQQVDAINANLSYDELDKVFFTACVVFDLTEAQLDAMPMKAAGKLVRKVKHIFSSEIRPLVINRIGRYRMLYDVASFTFGQYIELAFYFQQTSRNAHYILASCSRPAFRRYRTEGHKRRADRFLFAPMDQAVGALQVIRQRFETLNREYKWLFGLDDGAHTPQAEVDPFNQRYGWVYSASAVADYERITLDEAYALPVRRAFHDLAFLKQKASYEIRERDRFMKEHKI